MPKAKPYKTTDGKEFDGDLLDALKQIKGFLKVASVARQERRKIEGVEEQAEQRSLMGLGKVINAGLREVLKCAHVFVALTNTEFEWGCEPSLLMKKGDRIVGTEVRDPQTIASLSENKNVWFLHRNFVVYKDKVSFPQDIMQKICHFEIPFHTADWLQWAKNKPGSCIYGFPSTPCDVYLKERYFGAKDSPGSGTVLIGVEPLDFPEFDWAQYSNGRDQATS